MEVSNRHVMLSRAYERQRVRVRAERRAKFLGRLGWVGVWLCFWLGLVRPFIRSAKRLRGRK